MFGLKGFSQNKITGTVKDTAGNILAGAVVTIKSEHSNAILSYGTADIDGHFSVAISTDALNLVISVLHLGYKTFDKKITNTSQNISITLEESIEALKEVVVTSYNIEKKGDTLSYSVSAFKDQKDRTIADVLKKMPGIEVLSNGQILYMGNAIEKYYIEGMDMLEGRYNLANDNISADDVSKVQILENHQPIKVLDSLVFSDKTSLNIKLKNNVSVTGSAEIGGGFSPVLFKTNITPLVFTKRSQALVSYQYNNTGDDLSRSNNDFSTSDNLTTGFDAVRKNILSLRQLSQPPFLGARWLDNNDHLANINYLYRIKNATDLKINLSYLNGSRMDHGSRNTTYITQNDTINYGENIDNILFLNSLNSKFTIERNQSKSYLLNTFVANTFWDSQRGTIINDNLDVSQQLSNPYLLLTNKLKIIKPIGKQLITFDSSSGYTDTEQELTVLPGQFEEILNDGQDYESNRQGTRLSTFFTENTVGFTKKLGAFTISPKAGLAYKHQKLTSDLQKTFDGNQTQIDGDYQNDLQLTNSNLFVTNHLNFKKDRWTIVLKSPLYLRYFKTDHKISSQQQTLRRLNFEPDLTITKKLSPYWEASVRGNIENRYGEIDNLFDGYMLKNYLSLVRYNSTLGEQTNYASSLSIKYRNALKALFATATFGLTKNENNLLYNSSIADNGSLIIESIERDNEVTAQSVNFNVSKYFSKAKTTLTLNSRFSFSERPQIVNGTFGSFKSTDQRYDVDVKSEIAKWFGLGASSRLTVARLQSTNDQFSAIKNLESSIATFFYLSDHQFLNIDAEHYYNNIGTSKNNNYFLNFSYQFTVNKYNLDTKIAWNNVLNTKNYISAFNGQFFSSENFYKLRPSQLLITFKFSL